MERYLPVKVMTQEVGALLTNCSMWPVDLDLLHHLLGPTELTDGR